MAYDDLRDRLRAPPAELSVAAFPDGSVDTYYRALDGDEGLESREALSAVLAAGRDSLRLQRRQRLAGGQSVNMALQAHAVGDEVALAGHLDDPVFDGLPFATASLGAPATVSVLLFDDGDLMLAEESRDLREWDVADLRTAARRLESGEAGERTEDADASGPPTEDPEKPTTEDAIPPTGDPETDPLGSLLGADLVCSANWSAFHGATEVFEAVAEAGGAGAEAGEGVFVFDPGSLGGLTEDRVGRLLDGLGALEPTYRTVLAGNGVEIEAIAEAAGVDASDRARAVAGVREAAGISGVVAHEEEAAVAGTEEGTVVVPNLEAPRVATATGAGDRFTAGLGHGLAAGWGWETALALGNTCASYHVVHGETIERDEVADYVQRHEPTF